MSDKADFSYEAEKAPSGVLFVAGYEVSPVYPSAAAAERALNPTYAENGRYPVAFGRNGERYSVEREGRGVRIQPTGEADTPEELRLLLLRHCEESRHAVDESISLPELVEEVWRSDSEFWRINDPYGERFWRDFDLPWWGCLGTPLVVGALLYGFLIAHDWRVAALLVAEVAFMLGVAELARRKADKMDFRRR